MSVTITDSVQFVTNGERIGVTSGNVPLSPIEGVMHIWNDGAAAVGLLVASSWTGSAESPYRNHDGILSVTFNKTISDSQNRSWALSCSNAYHDIPVGVIDSGERIGVIGWAGSVAKPGYVHSGTLAGQYGVQGTAGFQGAGSAPTAIIEEAVGVRGLIYADSAGATIKSAYGGLFVSDGGESRIEKSFGVYARATGGSTSSYSFYGDGGRLFNAGQVTVGVELSQSNSSLAARKAGNSLEFGHTDSHGYGSTVGATYSQGYPFVAFCAEADAEGDTFSTRGKAGVVISSNLAGALIFSRLVNSEESGQSPLEAARIDSDGRLVLAYTPVIPERTPASATSPGVKGEIGWDEGYIYVCIAEDTWKRVVLSAW